MRVQWVNRPNLDFRGFCGTIASGQCRPGDCVVVPSSGQQSRISRIVTMDGDLEIASAGQSVTLTLEDEIDISRGDMLTVPEQRPEFADQFEAKIVWLHEDALLPGRSYLLKAGSAVTPAQISALKHKVNVNTLQFEPGKTLEMNEVGVCNIALDRAIAFDAYVDNRHTGNFILIDRFTNATVGAGMIDFALRRATNIHWQAVEVDKQARAEIKKQQPRVLWFTGLSGAGKSTLANLVEQKLHSLGKHTYLLDGDNVRHGLNRDLGFTDADRVENIRRIAETSKLFVDAGIIVLTAFISPFRSERAMAREILEPGEFIEIFVDTPLAVCEQRDPKGLYKKARSGELKNFTGIDSAYESPENPEIVINGAERSAEELAEKIVMELFG
jgi:bifunctional enzyme CysN/CysC